MDESNIFDARPPFAELDITLDFVGGSGEKYADPVGPKQASTPTARDDEDELETLNTSAGQVAGGRSRSPPKSQAFLDESTFGFSLPRGTSDVPMIADENGSFLMNNTFNMSIFPSVPFKHADKRVPTKMDSPKTKVTPKKINKYDTTSMSVLLNDWHNSEIEAIPILDESMPCAARLLPEELLRVSPSKTPAKLPSRKPQVFAPAIAQSDDVFKMPSTPASRILPANAGMQRQPPTSVPTRQPGPATGESIAGLNSRSLPTPIKSAATPIARKYTTATSEAIASSENRIRAMLAAKSPTKSSASARKGIAAPSQPAANIFARSPVIASESDAHKSPDKTLVSRTEVTRSAFTTMTSSQEKEGRRETPFSSMPRSPTQTTLTSQSRSAVRSQTYQNINDVLSQPLTTPRRGGITRSRTTGGLSALSAASGIQSPFKTPMPSSKSSVGLAQASNGKSGMITSRSSGALSSITNASGLTPSSSMQRISGIQNSRTQEMVTPLKSVRRRTSRPSLASASQEYTSASNRSPTKASNSRSSDGASAGMSSRRRSLIPAATPVKSSNAARSNRNAFPSAAVSGGQTSPAAADIPRRRRL